MKKIKFLICYLIVSLFLVFYGLVFVYLGSGCAPGSTCPSRTDVLIDAFLLPLLFVVLAPSFYYLCTNFKSKITTKKLTFLVAGLIVVTFIIAGWAVHIRYFEPRASQPIEELSLYFLADNDTLELVSVSAENEYYLFWEYITIVGQPTGDADLPTGSIDKGDVITNCTGEFCLFFELLEKVIYCSPKF